MKSIKLVFAVLLALIMNISCSAQPGKTEDNNKIVKADKVEVFYFHYTRRCATCNAVESVSRDAITELYGANVSFADYNLDEADGEAKANSLEVSGQTLLIVAGTAKINITNEGFMNARSNPEKLKQIIKEKIDPLM